MATSLEVFREGYAEAFRAYVTGAGEAGLERAYDLGRRAVTDGLSMLDLASIHHAELVRALDAAGPEGAERVGSAAAAFLIESLSTFEMTQRGFQEAQRTARLERKHAARLQALADAALSISSAHAPAQMLGLLAEHAREILGAEVSEARLERPAGPDGPLAVVSPARAPVDAPSRLGELVTGSGRPVGLAGDESSGAWLAAPLIGREGDHVGAVRVRGAPGAGFGDADLAILAQLAQAASAALERVRLYEREHEIASTLQRSLLPPHLPDIPGVQAAARFLPAGEGNEMGGDFYDVFEAPDGGWLVVIGDVCGKGAEAAAVTALARYTLRATALHESRPSRLLELLNEAMLRHGPDQRFATVACCRLDPATGRLELACGGHPSPLLVRANGTVEQIGATGTLLGVVAVPELADAAAELEPGDRVVFYTDGVTDAHAPERIVGPGDLAAALVSHRELDPAAIAELVEELALGDSGEPPRDDIAILVLALGEGPGARATTRREETTDIRARLSGGPDAAFEARQALESLGEPLGERLFGALRLVVTELVTNSVRHGMAQAGTLVSLRVAVSPELVRVEVSDSGDWFEPPAEPSDGEPGTSGWGLAIVARLVHRWGIEREVRGKTVWAEIDRPGR